ncbi:hypothetical protein ES695_01885 [Candidatus Atribacteria bacterium 1244-E10-H5-B2]|nr:MAG: hypothetical protein ES695_01885 [Candidatus Atribacteria bacterium 1244-E10-H5-B2]
MAITCVTDDPYMRDFYHWVLQGHWVGGFNPVDEGFEWNVAGGEINNISIGYPKSPFWYELGNNPDYLSSRKLYYYRAWHTYYDGEELVKIYGEMKQFTAINPNCTGFTNFQAKKMIHKYYSYHGGIMACKIQPNPGTFICEDTDLPWGPEIQVKFTTILSYGFRATGYEYNEVHDRVLGNTNVRTIGQEYYPRTTQIRINRHFVAFTTQNLPGDCCIVSAYLRILTGYLYPTVPFNVVIRNGMPLWPDVGNPRENYNFANYSGNGGSAPAEGQVWMIINLNPAGLLWITKTDNTKFALLSSRDIARAHPSTEEMMDITSLSINQQLWVTYKLPL